MRLLSIVFLIFCCVSRAANDRDKAVEIIHKEFERIREVEKTQGARKAEVEELKKLMANVTDPALVREIKRKIDERTTQELTSALRVANFISLINIAIGTFKDESILTDLSPIEKAFYDLSKLSDGIETDIKREELIEILRSGDKCEVDLDFGNLLGKLKGKTWH